MICREFINPRITRSIRQQQQELGSHPWFDRESVRNPLANSPPELQKRVAVSMEHVGLAMQ